MTDAKEHYVLVDRPTADRPYHYKECGLDNVYLSNGFELVEEDGELLVSIENVDGLWKAIGLNLITSQKVLSSREIRFLRGQMQMTQAELAAKLRVDDQTYARWEKGRSQLPGPADVALRACFLACDVAQPEGGEILDKWLELLNDLIDRDQPLKDGVLFDCVNSTWSAKAA